MVFSYRATPIDRHWKVKYNPFGEKSEKTIMPRFISRSFIVILSLWTLYLSGCGARDPFEYVKVSGKVTYEDGMLIPLDGMFLNFYSQTPPVDAKTYPRIGTTLVQKSDGTFSSVTSHRAGDGLIRGKHKVTVTSSTQAPLPSSMVPVEYADPEKTPLEVDTAQQPFVLKVRKPK
jgi:hypothetical protein